MCFTFIHAYFHVSRKVPLVFWGKMRKMMPRLEISSTMRKSTTSWKMMTSKLFHFSILDRISWGLFPGPARVFPICIIVIAIFCNFSKIPTFRPKSPAPLMDNWKVTDNSCVNFNDVFFFIFAIIWQKRKKTHHGDLRMSRP